MKGVSRRRAAVVGASLAVVAAAAVSAAPRVSALMPPSFGTPVTLPSSTGGEPSLAIDTNPGSPFQGYMYVVSPNATANGPASWYSSDGGSTWSQPVRIDNGTFGTAPGGDTDVAVQKNGHVIVTDLDVTHATVQVSTDHAATYNSGTITAPEDDRPWLSTQGNSTVYVAYHDFVGEVPIVCKSTDGGNTFPTCQQAFATPTALQPVVNCTENTVPARALVVDPTDGSLNFMFSCSTTAENAAHPPYGPLHDYYMARSTNGGTTFNTLSTVFIAQTARGQKPNYSNIFGTLASDSAGNYYALFDGTADDNHVLTHHFGVYYMWSHDKGATWHGPYEIDNGGTNVLAHFAVTSPGNVDAVWYHADAVGEPNGQCGSTGQVTNCMDGTQNDGMQPGGPVPGDWKVVMSQSTNANTMFPTFSTPTDVDPNYRHFGTICTNGIVCGGVSDRHLLDFISVAVDCSGAAHVTYGADQNSPTAYEGNPPADGPLTTVVTNQNGGALIDPPASCSPATNVPELPLVPLGVFSGAVAIGAVSWIRRRRDRGSLGATH